MNRKDITKKLSEILVSTRLTGAGKYYASEVCLDYGTSDVRRVDFLQFVPAFTTSADGIEKGKFVCYEVKSCLEDVFSGNGLNFIGEQNYIVTTMQTWKELQHRMFNGDFSRHLAKTNPESSKYYGVIVAVPSMRSEEDEYDDPTPFDSGCDWKTTIVLPCRNGPRNRSMTQLLFYMLRSGQ
jgi:hypothetical protein